MDQSRDDLTEHVVRSKGEPCIIYQRLSRKGASRAKNIAIRMSKGDSLLFTDDDCLVSQDWIGAITGIFERHQEIGAIAGKVMPDYSRQSLLVEPRSVWLEESERVFKVLVDPWQVGGGSGNNLAIRKDSLKSAGLFDEMLGPGAPLKSGEDGDMVYRLLKTGINILYSPEVLVYHRAWRSREDNLRLSFNYGLGRGGFLTKHIAERDNFVYKLSIKLLQQTLKRLFTVSTGPARAEASYFLVGLLLGQILMAHHVITKKHSHINHS